MQRALRLPVVRRLYSKISYYCLPYYPYTRISKLPTDTLLAVMRHEAHRIEKAFYNDILESRADVYREKASRLDVIFDEISKRDGLEKDPSVLWAKEIRDAYPNVYESFIAKHREQAPRFDSAALDTYLDVLKKRRSVRVWSSNQPAAEALYNIGTRLVACASCAPCSGDRQPWRFRILVEKGDKLLLKGLKEAHCYNAPMLIFVGMDTSVYGALSAAKSELESLVQIDAGAAIMNMVNAAQMSGLGSCWNHLGKDTVSSRRKNGPVYARFCEKMKIPNHIEPIAVVAFGNAAYIPPEPLRMELQRMLPKLPS